MSCPFKREVNPKPILPKCKYDLECKDYTRDHRFGFYHNTFGNHHSERMHFLLKTGLYVLSKKKKDATFSPKYLWDQFSCDLKDEIYHEFLIFSYLYTLDHRNDAIDLMTIKQAFTGLEESNITGIYYLNVAFMMWIFKISSLRELVELLDRLVSQGVIVEKFDIHFNRLIEIIRFIPKRKINPVLAKHLEILDETTLKGIYSDFMLGETYPKNGEMELVWRTEKKIMDVQQQMFQDVPSYIISNTGLTMMITEFVRISGYDGNVQTGHFLEPNQNKSI